MENKILNKVKTIHRRLKVVLFSMKNSRIFDEKFELFIERVKTARRERKNSSSRA